MNHTPSVTVRAPGKVNVGLFVGPLRPDGFHDLLSVFHAVDLYEQVRATAAPDGSMTVAVDIDVAGVAPEEIPLDETNLALRAARELAAFAGVTAGVDLHITKRIPVAGGMAGGSADAAASLLACARLWGLDLSATELSALAATLGSDVPFALLGGAAVGRGRGEVLASIPSAEFNWVFVLDEQGLSTPDVYRECDRLRAVQASVAGDSVAEDLTDPTQLLEALANGSVTALAAALANDLQVAAISLAPQLRETLDSGVRLGAVGALVSGSGPTCAFLAADASHADQLATAFHALGRHALVSTGPARGAHIVSTVGR